MTQVEAIQSAIEALAPQDLDILRSWFEEREWGRWDREIERDSASGKLDFLIEEAKQAASTNNIRIY